MHFRFRHQSLDLMDGKLVKEDVFPCLSRGSDAFRVYLTSSELILQSVKDEQTIERFQLEDLFGCHTLKHAKKANEPGAYLCFYMYPKNKRSGILSSVKSRERTPLVFLVQKPGKSFKENLEFATKWKDETLKHLRSLFPVWLNYKPFKSSSGSVHTTHEEDTVGQNLSDSRNYLTTTPEFSVAISSYHLLQRRYLVILNPKSGQGKSISIYRDKVAPILQEAGIKAELFITERAGHANSFVSTANFHDLHGICTVGGDGLLFEVVNGLRSRPDGSQIAHIPVGVIAGGSGNGLARSLASYTGESSDYLKNPVLSTTLAVARGRVVQVNLTEVDLDEKRLFSFLSAGWGLLADIDVESEILRPIGEPRFTVWSLLRLMKLKTYRAQLSYIPCSHVSEKPVIREPIPETDVGDISARTSIEGDFISIYSSIQSYIGSDLIFAPKATANDGRIHLTFIRSNAGRACATQFLLALDKGTHTNINGVTYVAVKEFSLQSKGGIGGNLVIDGERVSAEKMIVRISPTPLNVFSM
ncbi:unnamed protein product [Allacma fusca]|uniref:DAGKc domain-containing protein n=1 Tax=Allacma fusca TaxID=39272 RepID=A0A8J2JB36_9HEXA|nr:unnamed protein product [Allacma fusca]